MRSQPEIRGHYHPLGFHLEWRDADMQSSFLSSNFPRVSGSNFQILTSFSYFSLQMTAVQSPPRLQMALWSTQFAITVRPTTDCVLKEMVRAGQMSPQLPLPGTSMMNGPGVVGQKVQVLSLDPDLDSNKDFVTSSCGLLRKLTLLSPKFCLLLRGGDAT